jgi:TDG/mug DNA glycosylase family protein
VLHPVEDALLVDYGIGVMDLSSTPSARAHDLTQGTFLSGADYVKHIVERMAPKAVCCNGYGVYAILQGKRQIRSGMQPDMTIGGAPVFAMPSSSGAAAAFTLERRAGWIELGAYLGNSNLTPLQST